MSKLRGDKGGLLTRLSSEVADRESAASENQIADIDGAVCIVDAPARQTSKIMRHLATRIHARHFDSSLREMALARPRRVANCRHFAVGGPKRSRIAILER